MGFEDIKIRDLSRLGGEWTPPIGAMGGPPAHQLYTDLVLHAGLQLFRDNIGRPWVVLRDGSQRRTFPVPSPELRSALDRFRMHRNLSPVPENHIDEFVRVVQARVSDPDVVIPLLRAPVAEPASAPEWSAPPSPPTPPTDPDPEPELEWKGLVEDLLAPFEDVEGARQPPVDPPDPEPSSATEDTGEVVPVTPIVPETRIDVSVSGGVRLPPEETTGLARYVSVLQALVREGSWIGTTEELSDLTQEEPLAVFDSLTKYRSELEKHNLLVTSVEVESGFRWLAVDRAKTEHASHARVPDYRALPPS